MKAWNYSGTVYHGTRVQVRVVGVSVTYCVTLTFTSTK